MSTDQLEMKYATKIMNFRRLEKGMSINLIWDNSILNHVDVNNIQKIMKEAAQTLVNIISNRITHNVICSHSDALEMAESATNLCTVASYHFFREVYQKSISTSKTRTKFFQDNLPEINPLPDQSTIFLTSTQMNVFGMIRAQKNYTNQCFINFNVKKDNLLGICFHELTETLGRTSGFEQNGLFFRSILDLCNYIEPNKRNFESYKSSSYFSINNGLSSIAYFNSDSKGDVVDWDSDKHPNDCFKSISKPNQLESLTYTDLIVLELLGYDLAPIEYQFDQMKIPIGCHFLTSLKSNYSMIKGPIKFEIVPSLPDGLLFSSNDGIITGTTKILSEPKKYTVIIKIDEHQSPNIELKGEFALVVVATPEYLLAQQKLKDLENIRKNKPNSTTEEALDETTGLSTTAIVFIVLLSLLVMTAIIGMSIYFARIYKKNQAKI